MAKFQTAFNSVSHGSDEFFAADGVVDIPDEHLPAFAAMIESGELARIEDAPVDEQADDKSRRKGRRE